MEIVLVVIGLITAVIGLIAAIIGLRTALLNHQHGPQRGSPSRTVTPQYNQRRQFPTITWAVVLGVGAVGVTISSQFLGDQLQQLFPPDSPGVVSQQPSSDKPSDSQDSPGDLSQQPSTEDSLDTPPNSRDSDSRERTFPDNLSPSSTAVDYSKLEDFLQRGQWEEADEETDNLMLEVANREEEGWLNDESIETFPCDVLSQIDRLWVDHSGGKFGFSIQKKIYIENCGGKPDGQHDETTWLCFADAVGWRVNQSDLWGRRSSNQIGWVQPIRPLGSQIELYAPEGYLPNPKATLWDETDDRFSFFSRAAVCKL